MARATTDFYYEDVVCHNNLLVKGNLTVEGDFTLGDTTADDMTLVGQLIFDRSTADVTVDAANPAAARTYTIPDTGTSTANFVMTELAQTINGVKTFGAQPVFKAGVTSSDGVKFAGATNGCVVVGADHATARVYTIPDCGAAASFVMSELAQTINGVKTFGAQPVFKAGVTSSDGVKFAGATNGCVVVGADHATSRIYTIPDCGAAASFVMSELAQTINGVKTFGAQPAFKAGVTNADGVKFNGATFGCVVVGADQAALRVYTIPAAGGDAEFVMTAGNQTIGGTKTFSTPLVAASVNESVKREPVVFNFAGGLLLVDGTTYVCSVPMRRAGTVKSISISAHTRIAGGTNTIALAKKQGGTSVTLLSTATIDPTAVPTAADTAEALTLTATGADLIFAAGDCLKATLVTGTQGTPGQGYAIHIEVEYTDV